MIETEIRPEIMRFAEAMQVVMEKHDKDKGDSWKKMSIEGLQTLLKKEIRELPEGPGDIQEYVDVANFCMMLWWHQARESRRNYETIDEEYFGQLNLFVAEKDKPKSFDEWEFLGSFEVDFLWAMLDLIRKKGEPINGQISVLKYKGELAPLVATYPDGKFIMCAPRHNPAWSLHEEQDERNTRLFFENNMGD